jgi:membrane protease YdiL (CAAX protease family)
MDKISIKNVNLFLLIVLPLTFTIVTPYCHILMFIIIQAWTGRNDLKLRDFLYFRKTKISIILLSVLIGALLALIFFFEHFYFQFAIESIGKTKLSLSLSFLWFIFVFCILGPPVEELLFRGVLYNFYKKKGILPAIILSSVIFSMLHFNLYGIVSIFIIGVFLALLYEITQCFWVPVLVHSSVNTIHSLLAVEPIAIFLKAFLYWLHGGNVWIFRIKLLFTSIVLCILALLVMFLIMRINGNNIFQGKGFKNLILINRDGDDPLIDKYLISVFIISICMILYGLCFLT